MDWIKENGAAIILVVVVLGLAVGVGYGIDYRKRAGADPGRSDHARACVEAHGTIHTYNHGGRDSERTFWCTDSDSRITDIWFS